ncbi:S1 RNA-binding domain-containing protein [Paraliobacillus sp. JSM ZJ581]|uniref:CvfB family protein n=1 Tax=Paraliobacillus sp. JSM ZJ581 TaxID=3342118 RepID=UPI0035A85417
MKKLAAGQIVTLDVVSEDESSFILSNGDEQVFYNKKRNKKNLAFDQSYEVFLYQEKKQLYATTDLPSARTDVFDWAVVTKVQLDLGVFVDIGTCVSILVSSDDLPVFTTAWPEVGDELYVILDLDKKGRLLAKPVAESDFEGTWDHAPESLLDKDIEGRVFRTDREGAVLITEEGYRGFIHRTERKEEPRLGQWINGRVIAVKEDGTLNISLRPRKKEARQTDAAIILQYLVDHNGEMPFNDKTDPEMIYQVFQISKSAFKRALGKLMKEKKIEQIDGKTRLLKE